MNQDWGYFLITSSMAWGIYFPFIALLIIITEREAGRVRKESWRLIRWMLYSTPVVIMVLAWFGHWLITGRGI